MDAIKVKGFWGRMFSEDATHPTTTRFDSDGDPLKKNGSGMLVLGQLQNDLVEI